MRRARAAAVCGVLLAVSVVWVGLWKQLPPLVRTEPIHALPVLFAARPIAYVTAGALILWVLLRAFPRLETWAAGLSRGVRWALGAGAGLLFAAAWIGLVIWPARVFLIAHMAVFLVPGGLMMLLLKK